MTGRSVGIQGALAIVALAAAYVTWQRGPELDQGEVFIWDLTRNDLEKVRYEDEEIKFFTELTKGKDKDGPFVQVRLSGHDLTNVGLPAGHPGVILKAPERLVRGNESASRLVERFTPFRAVRALGTLDAAKLKELGLDTSKKRLEVLARGQKRRFVIVPAPPGGSDPYIRDEADGRVYIVTRYILSDLQAAPTNLVERRLHAFRLEEIDHVVLQAAGKRRDYAASRFEDMPGIRLAPVETPDAPDQTAKNWHDRIWNLFPGEVMGQGEVPDGGQPVLSVKLEYFARGRPLGWVELAKTAPPKVSSDAPLITIAYARSEFSLGWMKMSGDALSLLTEGEQLLTKK
jgi:hypothetical protein